MRNQDKEAAPLRLMRIESGDQGKYSVRDNRTGRFVESDHPKGPNEHFVLMLKDKYARAALLAYAQAAAEDGQTLYAKDVTDLANRAGPCHDLCKKPD